MMTEPTPGIEASVVVCAFNEASQLSSCLRSLVEMDFPDHAYEVIVVDDESTDRTPTIGRGWAEDPDCSVSIRYFRIRHGGLSVARNTGVQKARGRYIAFIDGDAGADRFWLKNLLAELDGDQGISSVAGRVENLNEDSWFATFIHRAHFRASILAAKSRVIGTNMAFRRDVFESTGGFVDFFDRRGDETWLMLAYAENNPDKREGYTDEAVVFNSHPESFFEWMGLQWVEGRLAGVIEREKGSVMKRGIKTLLRFLNLGFYLLIPLSLFISVLPITWGVGGSIWAVRHFSRAKYYFHGFRLVRRSLGLWAALFSLLVTTMGLVVRDCACCFEVFRSMGAARIPLHQSVGVIEPEAGTPAQ